MNPIKAFAVILLLATTALTANAQEPYEQMIITYSPANRLISVSKDDGLYREETLPKSESKTVFFDASPALVRIKQLAEEGWELYDNSTFSNTYIFHLRRPLK